MKRITRIMKKCWLKLVYAFSAEWYKQKYPVFLKQLGIDIPDNYYEGGHGFIHPSVLFDGSDFSKISVGKNTTISIDVILLTHDFSISKGLKAINAPTSGKFIKPIRIGENCFIGLRTIILPGTTIGNNVIIGAGSVVKGNIPDNVVAAGNPARVICGIEEWTQRHYEARDYIEL